MCALILFRVWLNQGYSMPCTRSELQRTGRSYRQDRPCPTPDSRGSRSQMPENNHLLCSRHSVFRCAAPTGICRAQTASLHWEGCQLSVEVVLGGVLEVSLTFPRRLANRHMDGGALKVKFMLPRRSQTIIYVIFLTRALAGRYLAIVSSSSIACKSCPIAEVFEAGYWVRVAWGQPEAYSGKIISLTVVVRDGAGLACMKTSSGPCEAWCEHEYQ